MTYGTLAAQYDEFLDDARLPDDPIVKATFYQGALALTFLLTDSLRMDLDAGVLPLTFTPHVQRLMDELEGTVKERRAAPLM